LVIACRENLARLLRFQSSESKEIARPVDLPSPSSTINHLLGRSTEQGDPKAGGSSRPGRGIWRNQPKSDALATALWVKEQLVPTGVLIAIGLLVGMSLLFFARVVAALPANIVVEPANQY
jgi:hypothetical protein